MKKVCGLLILSVFSVIALCQEPKTVINVTRVFPKNDKITQFENALKNHAQKFHKGDQRWRVYSIETGPDAGGYHIVEGPVTWDQVDKRGDLGKEHTDDWNMHMSPLLLDKSSMGFYIYRADLSTVQLNEYSDKIAINHVFSRPGYGDELEEQIKKLKKVWEAGNQSIAVYSASSSGAPQITIVTRYKEGLKERETGFRKPIKERLEQTYGEGSWASFQQSQRNCVDHSWSEILFYHPELSSK